MNSIRTGSAGRAVHALAACAVVALALGAIALASAGGAIDLSHLFAFDWQHAAATGFAIANAPLVVNAEEQIALFEAKRAAAQDSATKILQKSIDEGRTLDPAETEAHKGHAAEVAAVDAHLVLLRQHAKLMQSKAKPVEPGAGRGEGAIEIAGSGPISVRRNLPKGVAFARYAMALGRAKGNIMHAEQLAKAAWNDTPEVGLFIGEIVKHGTIDGLMEKAAVAAGTTTDSAWAGPLVYAQNMVSEFIEYLRPMTILGRLTSVRRVPFNIRIPRQTAGTTGTFVGEGLAIPVGKPQFDSLSLTWAKAATIAVLTEELVRTSNPAAETLVRDDLAKGISAYLDKRFMDPSYPGVANVSPASVSNGVTSRQASGVTLAALDADVAYLQTQMANAEIGLQTAVWVMSPALAILLSTLRTAHGDIAFPDINVMGGTFKGLPVLTSNNVVSSGSPGEYQMFLVAQDEILLADDGQMLLDMSTEAAVQLDSAPSSSASSQISLWQTGQIGLKCERWINWAKRRSQAVQYIEYANRYGS